MSYIVVDVESDGPIPYQYSMICFGAVLAEPSLSKTFYGKVKPVSAIFDQESQESLAISGFSREEHEQFEEPKAVMEAFANGCLKIQKAGRSSSAITRHLIGSGSTGIFIFISGKTHLVFLQDVSATCIAE
jgi:hypothetical protein